MSANEDVGKHHGKSASYSPTASSHSDASFLDLNLKKCFESMRRRAAYTQEVAKDKAETESDAVVVTTRELVDECTSNPTEAGIDLDDDGRTGTPDSEGCCETSCLDREVRRLRVLKSYLGVLDADHGNKFERLTALATRIFRTPMAMVTIADLDKQYCISSRGLDFTSTMKSPFCTQAVLADCDLMVVNDATKDNRFNKDPQVTGYPNVRFYAGAPLICPEGHRLGTLCVMDSQPRSNAVTFDEKQSLMELAAMAMDNLVDLRTKKQYALKDPSQQIACTAHDLLTPLTGIALSLSLLKEDEGLQGKLTDQQRDMIETAANCSTVMNSICHKTMDFFREQARSSEVIVPLNSQRQGNLAARRAGPSTVKISDLVKNLNMVMEPFPKQVPIIILVDSNAPEEFVSDDMKIFRSASNFLTNSCAKTESGSIRFRISKWRNPETAEDELMFECEDTGPGVDVAKYPYLFKPVCCDPDPLRSTGCNTEMTEMVKESPREGIDRSGLGLYSVATQIESLGGRYGFRPRGHSIGTGELCDSKGTGAVFWFSIPLILPGSKDPPSVETSSNCLNGALERGRVASSSGLTKRISGLLGMESNSQKARSDQSLNRLNSEDAVVAYAATPSIESMRNKRFRSPDATPRMSQALVIEDSLVVRKNLARVLTKLGFEVTQAVNGMEGLKELKSSLYDLVLCDFLMPVMDGLDCIQQYRQWESVNRPFFKQYIIGISAHANNKDVEQGFKIGMNGFRSKPLTYKDMEELKKCDEFKRIRVELDQLGHEIDFLKRRKLEPERRLSITPDQKVCLVIEASTVVSKLSELASDTISWKIVPATDPDSALRLLKMRNWDAVLVDDELGCSRCISIFREWEKKHRVNRQKNVVLLSANYVSPEDKGACFQLPTGFDGALGKPIQLLSLQTFFKETRTSWEIVTR